MVTSPSVLVKQPQECGWVGGCWGNGTGGRGEKEFTVKSISLNVLFTAQTLPGFIFNSAIHISDGKQEPRFT